MAPLRAKTSKNVEEVTSNLTTQAPTILGSIVSDEEREHLNLPSYMLPSAPSANRHSYFVALASTPPPATKRKSEVSKS